MMNRLTFSAQIRSRVAQQPRRYIFAPSQPRLDPKHSPETYSKNVDESPPQAATLHSVDPDAESVQRPTDPLTGPWSRAGVQTEEYRHVEGKSAPYAPHDGEKGRYGSMPTGPDQGDTASRKKDSASEGSAAGRSG